MAKVDYRKDVSDIQVKAVLQQICEHYGKNVVVWSGDRNFVPSGGSQTSLHLKGKAADFSVEGLTLENVFQDLQSNLHFFNITEGYEVIYHGKFTETEGTHLHIGCFPKGRNQGMISFRREGMSKETKGKYSSITLPIPKAVSKFANKMMPDF